MITGKEWEDRFESSLKQNDVEYIRENSKRAYGVAVANKGKYDFETKHAAIECKTVITASNLRLPLPNKKNTALKTHQLKALKDAKTKGKTAGLLILIQKENRSFWLDIERFYGIIIDNGLVKHLSLDLLSRYGVEIFDLDQFVKEYVKR